MNGICRSVVSFLEVAIKLRSLNYLHFTIVVNFFQVFARTWILCVVMSVLTSDKLPLKISMGWRMRLQLWFNRLGITYIGILDRNFLLDIDDMFILIGQGRLFSEARVG